jgi:hypothetical protein
MTEQNPLKFLPAVQTSGKSTHVFSLYDSLQAESITLSGQTLIEQLIQKAKENGFTIKMAETKYENFGDSVFPVTYWPDGLVTIDYPDEPFKRK